RTPDPTAMRGIVRQHYQRLYTAGSVSDDEIEAYLSHINFKSESNETFYKKISPHNNYYFKMSPGIWNMVP
ncbi:hypothetical protein BCV72DRAFT_218298, partial [Rhizopus microsporus var. microsporus]